jgi:hypothetical protein
MTSALIILAFIIGVITGVYCLKLGMEWQCSMVPKEGLPLIVPECKPPPKVDKEELPPDDTQPKIMKHWFIGGDRN